MTKVENSPLREWLASIGASQSADTLEAAEIDLDVIAELCESDLRELGLPMGQRKRLLMGISALREAGAETAPEAPLASPRPERRQLSFVFCDLVGSTQLARRFDAEDMATILQSYHQICGDMAKRWGGRMLQQYGDGALLVFGHPIVHGDDPARAVRAGLEIIHEVQRARPVENVKLQVRIAIATGRVVIGDLSGNQDPDAVAGETPNLAARLQNVAEPGSVVISDSTRRLVGGAFDLRSAGSHELKGFGEPVQAWTVLGERDQSTSDARNASAIIGREDELAQLREGWRAAQKGVPQVFVVSGDPGIGKSWLTSYFSEEALRETPQARRIRAHCISFKTNSALHPFLGALSRRVGIKPSDTAEQIRQLVTNFPLLKKLSVPQADKLLAAQLGAGDEANPLEATAGQQKLAIFSLFAELARVESRVGPLLVEVEDVHWADPSSIEMMRNLTSQLGQMRIMIVLTQRSGFDLQLPDLGHVHKLNLGRLNLTASLKLAEATLAGQQMPRARLRDIVSKADGVPLFIEELTRATVLIGKEDVGRSISVPETLEDTLMARLTLLGEAKSIAQIAATIGRRFPRDVLREVAGVDDAVLDEALAQLEAADIATLAEGGGNPLYTFSHALIQDAAYASLLRAERRKLHKRIADILAQRATDSHVPQPEELARHYAGAEMVLEAVAKLIEAGQNATGRAAQIEANNHFKAGLDLLADNPDDATITGLRATLYALFGQSLLATVGFAAPEVGQAFETARKLSSEVGDVALAMASHYGVWTVAASRGERDKALQLAQEAVDLYGESEVPLFSIGAHFMAGVSALYQGDLDASEAALSKTLAHYSPDLSPALVQLFGDDLGSFTMIYLQWLHSLRGDFTAALDFKQRNQALSDQLGDQQIQTRTLGFTMSIMQMLQDQKAAGELAEELLERATERCYPYWVAVGQAGKGWTLCKESAFDEGLAFFEMAFGFLDLIGQRTPMGLLRSQQAESLIAAGCLEEARGVLEAAIAANESELDALYLPDLIQLRGRSYADEDPERAAADFVQAFDKARENGTWFFALRAAEQLQQLRGQEDAQAQSLMKEARLHLKFPDHLKLHGSFRAVLNAD